MSQLLVALIWITFAASGFAALFVLANAVRRAVNQALALREELAAAPSFCEIAHMAKRQKFSAPKSAGQLRETSSEKARSTFAYAAPLAMAA